MSAQPTPQRMAASAVAVALFAALVWFAVQKISAPPPPPERGNAKAGSAAIASPAM
jgi:hypothetical protein